jgi:hypothetical protein
MIDKILAGIAALTLCFVVGAIGYNEFAKKEITVLVSLREGEDPFAAMENLMPIGSKITRVRQVDGEKNRYEIVVKTMREKANLIDWLLKSHKITDAAIQGSILKDE